MAAPSKREMAAHPHVLLFPWPLQGHINPMLHLAAALLDAGLRVTFLHTEHNLRRLALAQAPPHHPRLRLLSVPDGLPDDHPHSADGLMDLFESMRTVGSAAYRALLRTETELAPNTNDEDEALPPVTCVVADGVMPFAISVAEEMGVPALAFRTESSCGFLAYLSVPRLLELGETPVPSDEPVHGVPGMEEFLRRRDLPRVVPGPPPGGDGDDEDGEVIGAGPDPVPVLLTIADTVARCAESRAVILNTAASMEGTTVARIVEHVRGDVFAVGPLHARPAAVERASQWSGDDACMAWLDGHQDRSVVYVNLGSLTMISGEQLAEFLHGLVAAGYAFLWVLRRDMVHQATTSSGRDGNGDILLEAAAAAAAAGAGGDRALVVEWAHRDLHYVLRHRAVGCFLTHAGWNSTLESAVEGVPVVCWPFFADQLIVSRFVDAVWKTGLDMKDVCDRAVVARMVRDAMESPEIRAAAQAMARQLRGEVAQGGSSSSQLERLVGFITDISAGAAQNPSSTDAVDKSSPA